MSEFKFSIGERVMVVESDITKPDPGEESVVYIILKRKKHFGKARDRNGEVIDYSGNLYMVDESGWNLEESLRPLPKEQPTTWEEFKVKTGWSPVKEAV